MKPRHQAVFLGTPWSRQLRPEVHLPPERLVKITLKDAGLDVVQSTEQVRTLLNALPGRRVGEAMEAALVEAPRLDPRRLPGNELAAPDQAIHLIGICSWDRPGQAGNVRSRGELNRRQAWLRPRDRAQIEEPSKKFRQRFSRSCGGTGRWNQPGHRQFPTGSFASRGDVVASTERSSPAKYASASRGEAPAQAAQGMGMTPQAASCSPISARMASTAASTVRYGPDSATSSTSSSSFL